MAGLNLNDLPDDCLIAWLDRLSPGQLFKVQRINRRFNRLAGDRLKTKIKAITLRRHEYNCQSSVKSLFSNCSHLVPINKNEVLVLGPCFKPNFNLESRRTHLLTVLAKCSGVKCIDFGARLQPNVLDEVVRLCPELECVMFEESAIQHDEWDRFFNQIGSRIVHFAKDFFAEVPDRRLLAQATTVAEKCPNIKRFDWATDCQVAGDLLSTFKMLPKICWVKLHCGELTSHFDCIADELFIKNLELIRTGRRVNRLSILNVGYLRPSPVDETVVFAELKKLDVSRRHGYHRDSVDCLIASRFPRLEKFCLSAAGCTEDHYDRLFRRMVSVKKLTICWDIMSQNEYPQLPQSAIYHLENLETIHLRIRHVPYDWQPDDLFKQLEEHINGIKSLKKLIVEIEPDENLEWQKAVEIKVKEMKIKQNRVEVDLILNYVI